MADTYYTPEEFSKIMKIKPETVRELCRRKKLPAIKIGRYWRVKVPAIKKETNEN